MLNVHEVQRVYYYEHEHCVGKDGIRYCKSDITTDENVAKQLDKHYRLASLSEVDEFIGMGYEPIPVIEVQEGIYGWIKMIEYITILGDTEVFQGYIFLQPNSDWEIKNFKDCLDRCIAEMKQF